MYAYGKNASHFLSHDQWILDKLIDMDIINLETTLGKTHLNKASISYENWHFSRLKSCHTGTAAYIISNKGAATLLQHFRSLSANDYMANDHAIFDQLLSQTLVY